MIEHCDGVTPRPTQQKTSKPLFQQALVVSTITHCGEEFVQS